MRKTKEEAEKTRYAILAAAEQLFLERGVAHTSLEHIARHAGVTRGAVYWHFQNKAHLFHEMLNQVRLPLEPLAQQLAAVDGLSSLQLLRDLCIEAMANLVLDEQRRRILTVLLRRCEFTEELREAEERHETFVNQFIALCEQQFALPTVQAHLQPGITPRLASRTLHALLVGLFSDWLRDPNLFDAQTDTPAMIDSCFRGLLRQWP
ncbi:TetR family transcriptional regulator [Ectopseudomonas guguanensis]|jgi:TetR/AcrR family transcriptional repressor of mexAB-oprM operon|uniref:Transcriptional regulator, TetR family n=1 Tax=Ectopseudomonas guguanensis TaxID=1198456 RepID=A0A1H0N366_9GAMM|nr:MULTISPECIES: TetR family transcriptional regulator [Pseudomonas]MDR8014980.1 TetR family transcriptional regulator [Pseudomonas guguanensis]MPT16865.1 TetR family transcriptional regulator [Pseudomonas sp.]WJH55435.1 TetR family transcriptional regulator [Pseudomonas guguanensis]SDO86810.1 transcriptional regulator, TetR family [Pseudomonas guguanensis]